MAVRHKCFVSYHGEDRDQVQNFIDRFDEGRDVFIRRAITMPDDVIQSDNLEYVLRRIRERFLRDSTVTIVMVGQCTWARKFVDWELQASLRRQVNGPPPNGLLAILLDPAAQRGRLPDRAKLNVESEYAQFRPYPSNASQLSTWIEEAFEARTAKAHLIENPRQRQINNRPCP